MNKGEERSRQITAVLNKKKTVYARTPDKTGFIFQSTSKKTLFNI